MCALGALDLISSLFARETEGAGALGAIAEDVACIILVGSLGSGRGVERDDPLQLTHSVEKQTVLAAALVPRSFQCL